MKKMCTILLFFVLLLIGCKKNEISTLTFNGYTYRTVTIGNQEWTVENLRTITYNDGTAIPKVKDSKTWSNLVTGAYCAYFNDEVYVTTYGYLYNWYSVNTGKLAPTNGGWRVPTDADWAKLIEYVGGPFISSSEFNAGARLKAQSGWMKGGNGTDDYGFSALPVGTRLPNWDFLSLGEDCLWWSSTENDSSTALLRCIRYNYSFVYRFYENKKNGYAVRLVRDR